MGLPHKGFGSLRLQPARFVPVGSPDPTGFGCSGNLQVSIKRGRLKSQDLDGLPLH